MDSRAKVKTVKYAAVKIQRGVTASNWFCGIGNVRVNTRTGVIGSKLVGSRCSKKTFEVSMANPAPAVVVSPLSPMRVAWAVAGFME